MESIRELSVVHRGMVGKMVALKLNDAVEVQPFQVAFCNAARLLSFLGNPFYSIPFPYLQFYYITSYASTYFPSVLAIETLVLSRPARTSLS